MKRFFFAFLLLGTQSAWSFINIESVRQETTAGFAGKTKAQLDGRKGNTEKIIAQVGSTNSYDFGANEILGLFYYQYGETSKVRDTHRGSGHLRYTRRHWEKISSEYFVQRQFDDFQNLGRRDLVGAGLRMEIVRGEDQYLFLGSGVFHESERLKTDPDNYDFRGNMYLSYFYKVRENFEISSILYYQPRVDTMKDFRILWQASFEYKLLSAISLNHEISVAHDSRPPSQVSQTDIIYMFGIAINY